MTGCLVIGLTSSLFIPEVPLVAASVYRTFGVPCSILPGPPVPVQHTTAGGTRRYPWARDCLRR